MEKRLLDATLEEIKIHSLKFTMDDLTRRLHISKTSLYKMTSSKEKLIAGIIEHIISDFNQQEKLILASAQTIPEKILAIVKIYTDIFDSFSKNICNDLQIMYPTQSQRWQDFQEAKIDDIMNLTKEAIDKGIYRPINIAVLRQCLVTTIPSLSDSEFLRKHNLTYSEAIKAISDIIVFGSIKY